MILVPIDNSYKQEMQQLIEGGESVDIYLEFVPYNLQDNSGNWYMRIKYNDIESDLRRVCATLNLFADKEDVLPFCVFVSSKTPYVEPWFLETFSSSTCEIYIITKEEKKALINFYK